MSDGEILSRAAGIRWLREHIVAGTCLTQLTRYGIPLSTPCTYTVVQVKPSAGLVLDDGKGNTNYRSQWPAKSLRVEGNIYHKDEGTRYAASYRIEPA